MFKRFPINRAERNDIDEFYRNVGVFKHPRLHPMNGPSVRDYA